MTEIGVITNPGSHRNKKGLESLCREVAGQPNLHHVILGNVSEIPEVLRTFAAKGVDLLAIVGGDGTVQATLTSLYSDRPFERFPTLAVLPGGRTNMIAADAGIRAWRGQGMAGVLALVRSGDLANSLTERRVIRVDNVSGMGSQYGMFFGAAGICRAILSCRRTFHGYGLNTDVASALTIAGSVLRLLTGRGGEDQICRGDRIVMVLDDEHIDEPSCLALLATTLDRLLLRSRPYWTGVAAPLHFSYVTYPPRRLGLYMPRLLYGGPRRKMPEESYFSRDANTVKMKLDGPFTLDGEFFEAEKDKSIVLSAEDRARFVRI